MTIQGFILIDVNGVALNNTGVVEQAGIGNKTVTKKIVKNGQTYTYVSGQAWRYWWRDVLQKEFNWKISPITKVDDKNQVFTEANPIDYDDDDIFGYMKARKETIKDADGNEIKNAKGKVKEENVTVTRVSPLKNSVIISVASTRVASNFSSASRQNDVPVPFGREEYSSIMRGMFSLDLSQVGTFASYNKTGFMNLSEKLKKYALEQKGVRELEDFFVKNKQGKPEILIQLPLEIRKKRITDTLKALNFMSGGAMQTNNMDDVTPKFILLATFKSGNHPFSHVATSDPINSEQVRLNIEGLKQVLKDYKDEFIGEIFIGKRIGFMDDYDVELKKLEALNSTENSESAEKQLYPSVKFCSVKEAIDSYCKQLETQLQ